ncbi:unnamed protein product [Rotaria sp. Silwood2]|nr:unnamed protein product [Rotaria sp. Silwood2]
MYLTFQIFYFYDIYLSEACRSANYGYGCKESCRHVPGKCNLNATHENESCTCNLGYQPPFCSRLIDQCAINSPCNNATEDCVTDPNNGIAICTCKLGYEREDIIRNCKGSIIKK